MCLISSFTEGDIPLVLVALLFSNLIHFFLLKLLCEPTLWSLSDEAAFLTKGPKETCRYIQVFLHS